jgi:hypothetical protein
MTQQSIVGLPIATDPDAELIALGMQLETAWAHERSLEDDTHIFGDAYEAAHGVSSAIVSRIEKLTALTLAGAKVKAQGISWCHSGEEIEAEDLNEPGTTSVRLAASLIRDRLALKDSGRA